VIGLPDLPPIGMGKRTVSEAMNEQGYTTGRAELMDKIAKIPAFDEPIEGSLTMDGTEQTLFIDEIGGNPPRYLEGYVDLSSMGAEDKIVLKIYVKISPNGDYKAYAEAPYEGIQDLPLAYLATKPTRYGLKITAKQTAGTYRTLTYQFFRRRVV
jgi:hypothetical protein